MMKRSIWESWVSPKFDREQALAKLKQALEIFKKLKRGDWAGACLQKIADLKPGQDQGREHLEQILLMQKQVGDYNGQRLTLLSLTGRHFSIGQYQRGLKYYDQLVEVERKRGDAREEIWELRQAGNVSINGGLYHKAMEYYEKALVTSRSSGVSLPAVPMSRSF